MKIAKVSAPRPNTTEVPCLPAPLAFVGEEAGAEVSMDGELGWMPALVSIVVGVTVAVVFIVEFEVVWVVVLYWD